MYPIVTSVWWIDQPYGQQVTHHYEKASASYGSRILLQKHSCPRSLYFLEVEIPPVHGNIGKTAGMSYGDVYLSSVAVFERTKVAIEDSLHSPGYALVRA